MAKRASIPVDGRIEIAQGEAPPPGRRQNVSGFDRAQSTFEVLGARRGTALEEVPKVGVNNASNAVIALLQMSNIRAEDEGDHIILLATGYFDSANRPKNLTPSDIDIYSADYGSKISILRLLLDKSVDGYILKHMETIAQGIFKLFGRVFRRKTNREAQSEMAADDESNDY